VTARPRTLLTLAAVAVAFAAADTYVVVLALPEMMSAVGVPIDQLQKAAPIVSGFLLGYVAMLPLIGRIADLRGRVPVLVAALVVFAVGSLLTALAYDMPTMVSGRFLQGVGGGGLVPATLALVADLYPVERRGVPLGIVSAVQEIGSVLGGFGFGLALAPVNAAVLAATDHTVHGLATATVVVARMVGMLVGISALTTIGLRRYYAEQSDMPGVREVCDGKSRCDEFTLLLKQAGIAQEHTVFLGAAVCAVVAGVLALVLFRSAATRAIDARTLLRSGG
jgi:MFS family permease